MNRLYWGISGSGLAAALWLSLSQSAAQEVGKASSLEVAKLEAKIADIESNWRTRGP